MTLRHLIGSAAFLAVVIVTAACDGGGTAAPEKRESYFEIVKVIPAPAKGLVDLTYGRGYLWVADEGDGGVLYKLDAATGDVIFSVGTSYGRPAALCSDGEHLYVAARDSGDVWRHTFDARLTETASYPTGLADVRGMYYDPGRRSFFLFDQATAAVYEFDAAWNLRREWRVGEKTEMIRGLCLADGRIWSADWRNGWLNRHDAASFDIERKFCTYGQHPAGLGWDGAYLFLGDTGRRKIYKLDISTAP